MTEVVLDVKLASLGVLNISPRGLADGGFAKTTTTCAAVKKLQF